VAQRKEAPPAYLPPKWENRDVYALQCLSRGEAEPEQQKRALEWIINNACATYDWPWRPGDQHETSVGCGRQFVGQQIIKLVNLNLEVLKNERN
jgi:hypothetical protein